MKNIAEELKNKKNKAKLAGGLKRLESQHAKGKLSARERIEVFADKNNYTIFEIKEKSLPHTYIDKTILKSIA